MPYKDKEKLKEYHRQYTKDHRTQKTRTMQRLRRIKRNSVVNPSPNTCIEETSCGKPVVNPVTNPKQDILNSLREKTLSLINKPVTNHVVNPKINEPEDVRIVFEESI